MAESILRVTEPARVPLVINDHPHLARQIGAALVHLGQEDFFDAGLTHVSQVFAWGTQPDPAANDFDQRPPSAYPAPDPNRNPNPDLPTHPDDATTSGIEKQTRTFDSATDGSHSGSTVSIQPPGIGLSSHAPAQARRAVAAGAAYVAIGPVYATGTKPEARPVTLDYVRWAAVHVQIPWFAIGGINLENLDEVLAAGARRVCVVSAILNAPNVARACRQWRNRLSAVPLPTPSPDQPPPLLPT